jgi:hypothetical protein
MLPDFFFDALGLFGAAMFVVAYAGAQLDRLDPQKPAALALNLGGAILILVSLLHDFNLGSFVLETIWGLIAAFGLARYFFRKGRN